MPHSHLIVQTEIMSNRNENNISASHLEDLKIFGISDRNDRNVTKQLAKWVQNHHHWQSHVNKIKYYTID